MEALIGASSLERNPRSHYNSRIVPAVGEKRFTELLGASFKTLPVKKPGKGDGDTPLEAVREAWEALKALVYRYRSLYARGFFYPYLEVFRSFSGTLDLVKRLRGIVFIDDINRRAGRATSTGGSSPTSTSGSGTAILHYLVDEFQDTSPVQWENMVPLIENSLSQGGSLFVVGDTKQAIYGFRDADYRIMRDLENRRHGVRFRGRAGPGTSRRTTAAGERSWISSSRSSWKRPRRTRSTRPIAGLSGLDSWAQEGRSPGTRARDS